MILVNGEEVKFEEFPNGETRIVSESFPEQRYTIQDISFKYENDSDLIKLLMVKNYLNQRQQGCNGQLTIYYMPYSRMDRSESGSPFTLKYISNFINSLGFKKIRVIEPHSDVTPALLNNAESIYINFDLLPLVMEEVDFNKEVDYLFFPDAGAAKRYHSLKGFKQLIGHKERDFKTGEIKSLQVVGDIDVFPQKVIIVDDLSSYGGTFVHSSKALKKLGVKELYLLVAHAENSIFKGKLFDNINKLFTTDSILTEQNYWENKKFESQLKIYNIEEVITIND
jgi:ribose-phosphate pyrophosphokinase